MAPSSSSTKKAARLAQKGKGKKVRFQGGTLFPLIVAIVLVFGIGTIVYARQTVPADDSSPPTIEDHWHAAYGFFLCDTWEQLAGNLEEANTPGSERFARTGVHSHDDGVIHWHPFTSAAVGRRAQLGLFLNVYGVQLDNDVLRFPDNQLGGQEFIEGETKCGDEDAELQVVVWDSFTDTDDGTTYIANFDNIPIKQNGMVFAIAFVPRDTDISMPPWAADLVALGAADTNQTRPEDTLVPGDTSVTDGTVTDGTVTGVTTATGDTVTGDTVTGEPAVTTTTAAATTTVAAVTATSTP